MNSEIPCGSIALAVITTATTFKVNLIELVSDTNVRFKLTRLNRCAVIGQITDAHSHELNIVNLLERLFDNFVKSLCNVDCSLAHRAGNIQSENNRLAVGVLFAVTALTHDVLRVKSRVKHTRLVDLTCAGVRGRLKRIYRTTTNRRSITAIRILSPRTAAHN